MLLSYHGNEAIKSELVARMDAHAAADEITQGIGWENGKGCFIGCSLNDYNHARWPEVLGLPEWLAHLCDQIFEGLPNEDAKAFATELPRRIPVGRDLEPVRHRIAIARMDRAIELQRKALEASHPRGVNEAIAQTIASLEIVRRCHEAEMGGNTCDWSAARSSARSAWSAARSSAWSAESAAESARSSAESAAESARSSAESAAESARSSAWSAESAAESAARSARSSAESARSASYIAERDALYTALAA